MHVAWVHLDVWLPSATTLEDLSYRTAHGQKVPVAIARRHQRQANWHVVRALEPRNVNHRRVQCLSNVILVTR